MIIYHTSPFIVEKPDICHSRDYLDFGKGFYATTIKEQAVKYAQRFILRDMNAYLNIYDLSEDFEEHYSDKRFPGYDGEWLDFVARCRKGSDTTGYDLVIGGIANDKVFRTIDLYFSGDITKNEALSKLEYEHPNNQLCLRSQSIIDTCLRFVKYEEIH